MSRDLDDNVIEQIKLCDKCIKAFKNSIYLNTNILCKLCRNKYDTQYLNQKTILLRKKYPEIYRHIFAIIEALT